MTNDQVTELTADIRAGSMKFWTDEASGLWAGYLAPRNYDLAFKATRRMLEKFDVPTVHRFVTEYDALTPQPYVMPAERAYTERVDPAKIKALLGARVDWDKQLGIMAGYMPTLERALPNVRWEAFSTQDIKNNFLTMLDLVERWDATRNCNACPDPKRCGRTSDTYRRGWVPGRGIVRKNPDGTLCLRVTWWPCDRRCLAYVDHMRRTGSEYPIPHRLEVGRTPEAPSTRSQPSDQPLRFRDVT